MGIFLTTFDISETHESSVSVILLHSWAWKSAAGILAGNL